MSRPADPANADTVGTAVRIQRATHDRLITEANRRCVSRNLIVNRAIVEWLDRAEAADLSAVQAQGPTTRGTSSGEGGGRGDG